MQYASLFNAIVKQHVQDLPLADHLLQVTKAHPYFAAAQFYLLQQLKHNDAAYLQQAAKTALLFNNPYWLQFQLKQTEAVTVKETPVIAMYTENTDNDDDTAVLVHQTEPLITVPQIQGKEEAFARLILQDEMIPPVPLEIPENSDNDDYAAVLVSTDEAIELARDAADNTDAPEETKSEQEMPAIKIDLAAAIKEAENDHAFSFEPMHLVDYFASQGIRLSDEVQTADKLGKQLKSFTEWLKTMKKVHVPDPETGAVTADISIQTMAEKSNAGGEIVTEAMAEVFAQQGKALKAIEVYKKLSLLNPLKSAFFAAKIEQLKGS